MDALHVSNPALFITLNVYVSNVDVSVSNPALFITLNVFVGEADACWF